MCSRTLWKNSWEKSPLLFLQEEYGDKGQERVCRVPLWGRVLGWEAYLLYCHPETCLLLRALVLCNKSWRALDHVLLLEDCLLCCYSGSCLITSLPLWWENTCYWNVLFAAVLTMSSFISVQPFQCLACSSVLVFFLIRYLTLRWERVTRTERERTSIQCKPGGLHFP